VVAVAASPARPVNVRHGEVGGGVFGGEEVGVVVAVVAAPMMAVSAASVFAVLTGH
jgi:hypothetical protein